LFATCFNRAYCCSRDHPKELIPDPTRQHCGPEPDHRDPLTIEHSDIPQNRTGQPMPQPVMLSQRSVETTNLIREDRRTTTSDTPAPTTRDVYQPGTRKRQSRRVTAAPSHDHETLTQPWLSGQAPVTFAEEGVGSGSRGDDLAEGAASQGLPVRYGLHVSATAGVDSPV
jgi:predicted phage gp36 major capsid-like protein